MPPIVSQPARASASIGPIHLFMVSLMKKFRQPFRAAL
jgi:hypothetical protein